MERWSVFSISRPMGVPVVTPSNTPDSILHLIGLTALGGEARGAGLAPIEIALQVAGGQLQAGGAAVDDAAQGRTVAFAKAGYREQFSDCIARHDAPTIAKGRIL